MINNRYFLCFALLMALQSMGQTTSKWTAFYNESKTLIGFKDAQENVKIEPKFSSFIPAKTFEHIMIVNEPERSKPRYYLTKFGDKCGVDSLFHIDMYDECEQEGFIRFRDPNSKKVGLLNRFGKVAIPAKYDVLSSVTNNLIWAFEANPENEKVKHKEEVSGCNHPLWSDGINTLLDTNNQILIEGFNSEGFINFYSLTITKEPSLDATKQSFKGVNGSYYNFTDILAEFKMWLQSDFLSNLNQKNFNALSYNKIKTDKTKIKGKTVTKSKFLKEDFNTLKTYLKALKDPNANFEIGLERSYLTPWDNILPNSYFTNCGKLKNDKYPICSILINTLSPSGNKQINLYFINSDKGYRFIGIRW